MNLVGKIFIVLIFVMAICWMMASVTVYATHTNWREVVEDPENGLNQQLQRAKERNQELTDQRDKLIAEIEAERVARRQALTKLETRVAQLEQQRGEQDERLAALVRSETDARSELKATQEAEAALRLEIAGGTAKDGTQVVGLREEIRQAREDRDKYFDQVVKLTDQLHQAANLYRALNQRTVTLAEDLAKAKEVLLIHDLKAEPVLYKDTPPPVEGVVLEVGPEGQTIEISIGSDDGLMEGHTLEVIREGGGWLGRVKVTQTSPDKAVCKVLPEFLQRPIQRNDRVTTKLR